MKNRILDRWDALCAGKGSCAAVRAADGRVARTFAALDKGAGEIADSLSAGSDRRVISLQMANSAEWIEAILGIWKAGHVALLIDAALPAGPRSLAERTCGAVARLFAGASGVAIERLDFDPVGLDERCDLIKLTSGTTGVPEALQFSATQLEADCENICETMGITDGDLNYGIVAFSHSYGFSNLVTPLLCRGIPVVAADDALPRAVMAGVAASDSTVLPAVPAIFQALSGIEGGLTSLRLCISAGAPLQARTAAEFRARFGVKVHSFYGASECGGICYDASGDEVKEDGFVGAELRGVQLVAVEGSPADGGRVEVRSEAVGLGAIGGESPRGVFSPADLLACRGGGWRIVGRESDFINIAGRKVSPGAIERVLRDHPAVREAVVFGIDDEKRGEAVCAWVVASAVTTEELLRHCAENLPNWQVPRELKIVREIPLSARGKVNRRELRAAHHATERTRAQPG